MKCDDAAIELKFFASDGMYEGAETIGERPRAELDEIAIGTFGDGGHVEVWRGNVRVFDVPATSMSELGTQIAGAEADD